MCVHPIPRLHDEVIEEIFSRLTPEDLLRASMSYKQLREVCSKQRIWRKVLSRRHKDVLHAINTQSGKRSQVAEAGTEINQCEACAPTLSQPCSLMQNYIQFCKSVRNQTLGIYTTHYTRTRPRFKLEGKLCNGKFLAVMSEEFLDIYNVYGGFTLVHSISLTDLCPGLETFLPCNFTCYMQENHLIFFCRCRISVYHIDYSTDAFSLVFQELMVPGFDFGWSDSSDEFVVYLSGKIDAEEDLRILNLSDNKPYTLPVSAHLMDRQTSYYTIGHRLYTTHLDPENQDGDIEIVKCWDLITAKEIFSSPRLVKSLHNPLAPSRDHDALYFPYGYRCVIAISRFNGKKISDIQTAMQYRTNVNYKNNILIVSKRLRGGGGFDAYPLDGPRTYDLETWGFGDDERHADDICDVTATGDIFLAVDKRSVKVYSIKTGKFLYRINLPTLPAADNKRSFVYSSEYMVVIATTSSLIMINFT